MTGYHDAVRCPKFVSGLVALLLILSSASIALPVRAQSGNVVDISAVVTHPVLSLSDFNNPLNFILYQSGFGMGVVGAYPYTYYAFNDSYVPALVQSDQTFPQNNTYILHLRHSGWSDGTPLTAWDFLGELGWVYGLGSPAYNTKVIDNYTISIQPPVLPKVGLNGLNIATKIFGPDGGDVPMLMPYRYMKTIVNDVLGNWTAVQSGNATVIGAITNEIVNQHFTMLWSGPYYPVSVTSSEIKMVKNPYYYDASKVPNDTIIVHQYTSPTPLYQALSSGSLSFYFAGGTINDRAGSVVPTSYQAVMPSYMEQFPLQGYTGPSILFNNNTVSLDVRKAIAYVLNRTEIASAGGISYHGLKWPIGLAEYMINSTYGGPTPTGLNPYNVNTTAATDLMKSAGYTLSNGVWTKGGTPLNLILLNTQSTDSTWLQMALDIQSQLAKFGIQTNLLNPQNPSQYTLKGTGYDMFMYPWGYFVTPWDIYRLIYQYDGYPYPVLHFPGNVTVPINNVGSTNAVSLFYKLENAHNETAMVKLDQDLAWLVDNYVPYLPLAENNAIVYLNTKEFNWPSPSSVLWQSLMPQDPGLTLVLAMESPNFGPASSTTTTTTSSSAVSTVTTTSVSTSTITGSVSTVTSASTSTVTTGVTSTVTTSGPTSTVTTGVTSTVTTTSTAISPAPSSNTLYYAVIAAIVVIVVAGLAIGMRSRRRPPPPKAQ